MMILVAAVAVTLGVAIELMARATSPGFSSPSKSVSYRCKPRFHLAAVNLIRRHLLVPVSFVERQ
jgi:hypothetical protein